MTKTNDELIQMALDNVMTGANENVILAVYAEIESRGLDANLDEKLSAMDLKI